MNEKLNILIFIDWFSPGFKAGGPIKSISNIVYSLNKEFNFYIITSDRDLDDKVPYANVELNKWLKKEDYSIAYLTPDQRNSFIENELKNNSFSVIYFNSIFSKNYTLQPLRLIKKNKISTPLIIAPRGMLGKGALSLKPIKKKIFLLSSKLLGFFNIVKWHATNIEEKKDIKAVFGNKAKVQIASNIVRINSSNKIIRKEKEALKLIFFSRISPKKNLLYALEIMKKVNNKAIQLAIYGSLEDDEYWKKCHTYINTHQLNAQYISEVNPSEVNTVLSNYHFLFLPTLHENYGHVIVEALTAGCGLIISKNTPWKDLAKFKIGWDIDLANENKFISILNECLEMNQEEYDLIRNNCFSFVKTKLDINKDISDTKKIFLQNWK